MWKWGREGGTAGRVEVGEGGTAGRVEVGGGGRKNRRGRRMEGKLRERELEGKKEGIYSC